MLDPLEDADSEVTKYLTDKLQQEKKNHKEWLFEEIINKSDVEKANLSQTTTFFREEC